MGFLSSLLKKDWPAELERAEKLFAEGRMVRALELALKIRKSGDETIRDSAGLLVDKIESGLLHDALAAAARAEAEGDLEDAADWLLAAIERSRDDRQQRELELRRTDLLDRAEEVESPFAEAPQAGEDPGVEISPEDRYDTLVSMLDEEIAPRYSGRTPAFQQAFVALNEGQGEAALELLDDLMETSPDDPVLALERGRAHLLLGQAEPARTDLESAWETFGDQPLDVMDGLSVPALWAEAALAMSDAAAVVERLEGVAKVELGRKEICSLFAVALSATAKPEESLAYLNAAMREFPREPRFPLLLAQLLASTGEVDEAIACLEFAVAPSCAGGGCSQPPKDIPSLRALAGLYLAKGEASDRAAELMAHVAHAQGGLFGAEDHRLLARFYELRGDTEASAHAAGEADRLGNADHHQASPAPPRLIGGSERIL